MPNLIYEDKYFIYDRPAKVNLKFIIKRIAYFFYNIYYKILLSVLKPQNNCVDKKFNVSICAIFKDEANYLKEWIEFHKIVGVEHFYLYNNNSSDNYKEILKPYIEKKLVTLIDWPKPQSQMEAYKDCVDNFAKETKWFGFIDLDEFVVPNDYEDIYSFLKNFEKNRPVVIVYWKQFGSSGIINRDINRLVTEDFTVAWRKYVNIGKYFFNTKYNYLSNYKRNEYMHAMWAEFKSFALPPVNCFDKIYLFGVNRATSVEPPIQINHYLLKSFSEYVEKKSKRGGGIHVDMHNLDYFWNHEKKSQAVDYHLNKYLVKLKLAMNESKNEVK